MLAARGAVVIDADAITRQLQETGQPVLAEMVNRFGDKILHDDGSLDRQAMAQLAFSDEQAKHDLEEIVHPAVREQVTKEVLSHTGTDEIVVYDIPLLTEIAGKPDGDGVVGHRPGPVVGGPPYSAIVVVDVDPETAVARLVEHREMNEADARARMSTQATRDERAALADRVVDNSGSLVELTRQVDQLWAWFQELAQAAAAADPNASERRREWGVGARLD